LNASEIDEQAIRLYGAAALAALVATCAPAFEGKGVTQIARGKYLQWLGS